jgi:acyl dehydratase
VTTTYRVRAHNFAEESENRIHADDVAQQYGFKGGLVPGVAVYAYMVRPVAAAWGRDWVERGTMTARFVKPLYEGDDAGVDFDEGSGDLTVHNSDGVVCATGRAGWTSANAPDVGAYPTTPLPQPRPPASAESLAVGTALGSLDAGFHADMAPTYLAQIRDDLVLWTEERIAHPGYLVTFANYILSSNVKLGPWIHVETTANHFGVVADGDRWSMRGRVADCYERKGHKFVELDLAVVANEDTPVMTLRHTAIYEPANRSA